MTTTPVLPEEAAYGIKSEYGFDQKNGHKQLIGVSVGRPGSWAGARVVELYTADQMRDYALAAIAAAQAAQLTDAERYRWLRNEAWGGNNISQRFPHVVEFKAGLVPRFVTELAEDALDAAIDAAITASKGAA